MSLPGDTEVIDVVIQGNTYQVACVKNQKQRILELASRFDRLVGATCGSVGRGRAQDGLLFLLAGLKLEDEIEELGKELSEYKRLYTEEVELRKQLEEALSCGVARIKKLSSQVSGLVKK